ncbi:E3 ubiquitin/ISG15 ligase TRIM25-like [Mytilus californianus]|uniref:E3 ubiquitin/ISG15 ligase TRIM25-like n=1 Tax=Mytilus californianus TaxID=6549 RepID=UPI002247D934|nr:E3 ubiquitin/ISG15 ligase TRIM25-like [Mytilus californianus]
MASSSIVVCGVCESQHTTTTAEFWCPECDEGLCSKCWNFHNASKALRYHGVISIDNYKQLPPSIANISQFCSEHNRKFQNYCLQHESLCCPLCIQSNHDKCMGILSLEKVIETAKTSALLESLDLNLKDIKMNVERVVKDRKQNLAEIQLQRQKFHDEIKQVRIKINEHLDNLEQRILHDLYAAEKKIKSQIEDLLEKVAENTEKVDLLQTDMRTIKEYASDLQAFLGSKMIETEIQKHEIFIQSLFEDASLQKMDINCKFNDTVSDLLSSVISIGSVSVQSSPPLVVMHTGKEKQVQTRSVQLAPPSAIKDIKMKLQTNIEYTGVTGCSVSSTGDIIIIHKQSNRVLILNEDGTLRNGIPLSTRNPVDVTFIDDKKIAVSFPDSKQIQIINITTKNVERTRKTASKCYGVSYRDGQLMFCGTGKGIQSIKVSGKFTSTLVKDDTLSNWSYVATSEDKIYYTNSSHHTVTSCSLTGEKMWEYKDQSVCSPQGIAVDKDSNVYIASNDNHSITVLSSDGKQARKLLEQDDGIDNPFGLAFDVNKGKLIVANYSESAVYALY